MYQDMLKRVLHKEAYGSEHIFSMIQGTLVSYQQIFTQYDI